MRGRFKGSRLCSTLTSLFQTKKRDGNCVVLRIGLVSENQRIVGRNEKSSSNEKRAAQMKCAKEMASLVDCTEKEMSAVVGSRSERNCNSDLIKEFKGGSN